MILKTNEGHFVELTEKEYRAFVVEIMVYFQRENKLELHFHNDGRVKASEMIFQTIATQGMHMDVETRANYLKLGHELLNSYYADVESGNIAKPSK
jgi:hypothetical protein